MRTKALRTGVAAFAALLPAAASAGTLSVCNRLDQVVNVAFAYSDPKLGPVSKGWWSLPAGQCSKPMFRGHGDTFYIYAAYSNGNAVLQNDNVPATWLCVSLSAFTDDFRKHVRNNTLNCEADNMLKRQFRRVSMPGDRPAVYELKPNAAPPSTPPPPGPQAQPVQPIQPAPSGPVSNPPSACQLFPNLC